MTAHVLTTLLMLAQVLACPFLDCGECLGECPTQRVEADNRCNKCCAADKAVCEQRSAERRSAPCDAPACPGDPGLLNCLCGGAVEAHAVECPDLLAGGDGLAVPQAALAHTTLLGGATSLSPPIEGCPHFPTLIPGVSVCALTQTYLL